VARRRLRARLLGGLVLAAVAVAAVGGGIALAADHAVAISGFSFSPATVTVAVGDTVTWTNSDSTAHTATADDGSFDTGTIGNGASGTVTFATAGTFAYHCSIHAQMTGTVVVEAAAGGGGTATQPPTDTVAVHSGTSSGVGVLLVLAGALLVGLIVGGRRFARS
jgi:plastocyanin